jgi:hypothetical protein
MTEPEQAPQPEIKRITVERRDAQGNLLGVFVWEDGKVTELPNGDH